MEYDNVPEFYEINTPSFDLAIRLVNILSSLPQTPQDTAILTLLFQQLDEREHLKKLEEDFLQKIQHFIDQPPRDQANQAGKVFLVACYAFSHRYTKNYYVRQQTINNSRKYMEYAAVQDWFEDPFLAYFCHFLIDDLPICNTTCEFFKEKYTHYLEKGNISAISQSLLVIGDKLNEVEKSRGFHIFEEKWQTCSARNLAWILLGLSISNDPRILKLSGRIAQKLNGYLDLPSSAFTQKSFLLDSIFLFEQTLTEDEINKYIHSLNEEISVQKQDDKLFVKIPVQENGGPVKDLFTFYLILYAVSRTGWHSFVGVYQAQKIDVVSLIENSKPLSKNQVVFSKGEVLISNTLTIVATLLIGISIVAYFSGVTIRSDSIIDCSKCNFKDIDVAVAALAILGILISQSIALITSKSAISYWLDVFPMNYFIKLISVIGEKIKGRL